MRRNKFGAKPTTVDNIRFASQKEARRYGELCLLQRAGKIRGLELQPRFPIVVNGIGCGEYRADFAYVENGQKVVEDAKGYATRMYKFKKRIVEALYGIKIKEV